MAREWGEGEAVKMLKTNKHKASQVTNFVQATSFISIYNGMYTVHLCEQVTLIELDNKTGIICL